MRHLEYRIVIRALSNSHAVLRSAAVSHCNVFSDVYVFNVRLTKTHSPITGSDVYIVFGELF